MYSEINYLASQTCLWAGDFKSAKRENVAKFMPSVAEIGGRPDKEMLSHYC
jgi:hypothetical protein